MKIITFPNLIGKKIAIDAFNVLFQFLAIIRGADGQPLKDLQGRNTSHLSGIFYRTLNMLEKKIKPIYVFDGPPNPFKHAEIERRRAIRREAEKKMREAQDLGQTKDAKKFAQASSKLNSEMIEESKVLIQAMGVPIVEASQDGEAQAAHLVNKGVAWAVGSQDYDALLFGAKRIVRNLSVSRTKKVRNTTVKVDLEWYTLEKVLETQEITQDQLIEIGLLIGVDFFPGIEGVGAKTALKLIKNHGTIENILENKVEVRKKPIALDLDTVLEVKKIFTEPSINSDFPKPKWSHPDKEKILEILCEKHDFSRDRVDSGLKRLMKINSSASQRTISSFFK